MQHHQVGTSIVACAALFACVSARSAAQGNRVPPPNDRAEALAAAGSPIRWQAALRATHQRTAIVSPSVQNKTTGTVFISPAGPDRVRVRITVSTTYHDGSALQWAIVPGRCASNMLPVTPVERFPIIEIGHNGRGELDIELALSLPATGQYHVNVYRGGTQMNHVLTCGNLTRGR